MHETAHEIESLDEIRHQPFVILLDDYISLHEKRFGRIKTERARTTRLKKLCRSFEQLKESLRQEKCHRTKAYEHLKDTNKTMRKTISELHEGFITCRKSIRNEFLKIENMDTWRLLNIDPISFAL